jgi:16S rRNA (guanine966-N2)-methyltransferase
MKVQGKQRKAKPATGSGRAGFVRIIGGEWRGRRLPVADVDGLRPSGDRCRETLFNWLQPSIRGARCADLFAGTGVLGLEAYSRGAAEVTLIESAPLAMQALRASLAKLEAPGPKAGIHLVETDVLRWLSACQPESLDIVFIDPPFGSRLETQVLERLSGGDCVRPGGLVYVETARNAPPTHPGLGWEILREQVLGEVRMLLLRRLETV